MNWYKKYLLANKTSYGWVNVPAPKAIAKKTIDFAKTLPDRELFKEQEGWESGIEDKPHITVLYGIESLDAHKIENALTGEKGGIINLGLIDVFESDEYDVLIVKIDSRPLHKLNKQLRANVKYKETFPDYHPHLTLAYLKCGNGEKYKSDDRFKGLSFKFNDVIFEDSQDRKTTINLERI